MGSQCGVFTAMASQASRVIQGTWCGGSVRARTQGSLLPDSWKRKAAVYEAFLENYVSAFLHVRSWAYGDTAIPRFPAGPCVIVSGFRAEDV